MAAMRFEWAQDAEPADLRWEDDDTVVGIDWNDGHESRYPVGYLRRICPCALCTDAHATPPISAKPNKPFTVLSNTQAQLAKATSKAKQAYPIGNYAIGFIWDDGHDDGIYSLRFLRGMCPCPECALRLKQEHQETL